MLHLPSQKPTHKVARLLNEKHGSFQDDSLSIPIHSTHCIKTRQFIHVVHLPAAQLEVKDSTIGREHPNFMQNLTDPRLSTFTDRSPATFLLNTQFFFARSEISTQFCWGELPPKSSSQHLFHEVGCINIVSTNGFCHIGFTAKDS